MRIHRTTDNRHTASASEKLADAKRQRFTTAGKSERISRSLAALSEPSRIRLTLDDWRQLAQDPDLEDQSS
jgi:hypothetical protein